MGICYPPAMTQPTGPTPARKLGRHALKALGAGITVPMDLMHSYSEERQQRGSMERAARTGCAWAILGPFVATFMVAFVFAIVAFVLWSYAAAVVLVALVALMVQAVSTRVRQHRDHP